MRLFLTMLSGALSLSLFAGTTAGEWPTFRGAARNGISAETGINKNWKAKAPKELWRIKLGDNGFAGPSVAAGKLFIIDKQGDEDVVRAVDLKTGKDVWTFKYPDSYQPGQADWGRGRSTPTFDNGKLYTLGASGMLHCLDAEKGTKLWALDIKATYNGQWKDWWGYTPAPMIDGEKVVVPPGGPGAALVALNKETGKEIWKGGGDEQAGYATPIIATLDGKKQYVTMTGLSLVGVDAADGKLLWKFGWNTSYQVNACDPVQVGPNNFFITSGYGKGCGLIQVAGGKATALWQNKEMKAQFNGPVLIGQHLYGISGQAGSKGDLTCLDPKTGASVWKQADFEVGGVCAIDGTIIAVSGKTGEVVMCAAVPNAFQELGRITPLNGRSWTPPIVADGKLFVRDMKELVALDLK